MAETVKDQYDETTHRDGRRGPDPVALVAGIVAILVSVYIVTGGSWFPSVDPRWLLAGAALLVGALMLLASTRSGRRRR